MGTTSKTTAETQLFASPELNSRNDAIAKVLLVLMTIGCCAPVLLHPHWGLLSDAGQIVQNGRIFWQAPMQHLDLLRGYWRPGFHFWDLALWAVAPENPLVFYVFKTFCLAATVVLTYCSIRRLTQSIPVSFCAAMLWFMTGATYEVIYTLDKGELYVALIFSGFIWSLLKCMDIARRGVATDRVANLRAIGPSLAVAFIVSLWGMFTKETCQLLLLFSAAFALLSTAAYTLLPGSERARKQSDPVNSWLFFLTVIAAYGLYKIYFYTTGGGTAPVYMQLSFAKESIYPKFHFYKEHLPELFWMSALSWVCLIAQCAKIFKPEAMELRISLSALVAVVFGAMAIFCMPTLLLYVWFPLYAFALVAAAVLVLQAVSHIGSENRLRPALCLIIVLWIYKVAPICAYQAQYQFQLDALTQELADKLSQYSRQNNLHNQEMVLPFSNPNEEELAERIQFFTMQRLIPNYIEQSYTDGKNSPYEFINLVRCILPDQSRTSERAGGNTKGLPPANPQMLGQADLSLARDQSDGKIGLKGYSFWSDSGVPGKNWVKNDIKPGALFLVPYGDLPENVSAFRAAGFFREDWRAKLACFPQLKFKELFSIQKEISMSKGRTKFIAWIVLQVEDVPQLAWDIDRSGWLMNHTRIYTGAQSYDRVLELGTDMAKPPEILPQSDRSSLTLTADRHNTYSIPIPAHADTTFLISSPGAAQPAKQTTSSTVNELQPMLHVVSARFERTDSLR
ncbi:MAG TPA: hypothetical protein V6C69_16525 [Trichormus sp.]